MEQRNLKIMENTALSDSLFKMKLQIDAEMFGQIKPGQFINIKIDGTYLRRPISINDAEKNELTIIYKVLGEGTKILSEMPGGKCLDTLLPLGNGFSLEEAGNKPVIIGGGVGTAPLYYLAKSLIETGKKPVIVLGFNTENDIFLKEEFEALGLETIIATADGSVGIKGFVTDALKEIDEYSYAYVCGPEPMLKAVNNVLKSSAQYSFEERMGCGFGACMGCSCKTIAGYKRICKDGPIMKKEELIWED